MKKLIKLLILSVAVVFFTGCGDVTDDTNYNDGSVINLYDLYDGYSIFGSSHRGSVRLDFCSNGNQYYYINGSVIDDGTFEVVDNGYKVDLYLSGDVSIKSLDGYFRIGSTYESSVPEDIYITDIIASNCY